MTVAVFKCAQRFPGKLTARATHLFLCHKSRGTNTAGRNAGRQADIPPTASFPSLLNTQRIAKKGGPRLRTGLGITTAEQRQTTTTTSSRRDGRIPFALASHRLPPPPPPPPAHRSCSRELCARPVLPGVMGPCAARGAVEEARAPCHGDSRGPRAHAAHLRHSALCWSGERASRERGKRER